jgi:hypothetical protein
MRLLICPYDYTGSGVSHTGLHISSMNTAKVLRDAGLDVLMYPVTAALGTPKIGQSIQQLVAKYAPTHVVTCAFWVPVPQMEQLVRSNPYVSFAVNCHSNIAFLQAEPNGIGICRQLIDLELTSPNFHLSGNSTYFVSAVEGSYEAPCAYLPNLYYLDHTARQNRPTFNGSTIRIGAFGALRPLKNPTVSAIAALFVANALHVQLQFFVNVGRNDGWGLKTLQAVRAIMNGLPNAQLMEIPWQNWPDHRRLVRTMNVMVQPSFSESFNLVTADGAAEGVPSAVGDAIDWVPSWWQGKPDDSNSIARVMLQLLNDGNASRDGVQALQRNNDTGVAAWKRYLGVS